jgi:hypothetical protein
VVKFKAALQCLKRLVSEHAHENRQQDIARHHVIEHAHPDGDRDGDQQRELDAARAEYCL